MEHACSARVRPEADGCCSEPSPRLGGATAAAEASLSSSTTCTTEFYPITHNLLPKEQVNRIVLENGQWQTRQNVANVVSARPRVCLAPSKL